MADKTRFRILWRLAMCVVVLAATMISDKTIAKDAGMGELVKLGSAYPFVETVERLRSALQSKGFTIFAIVDQREAAKSAGLDMPPTTLIVYGNPRGGTPIMIAAPDFAIELPLRLLVREDPSGNALVLFNPASALEGKHGLPPGMASKLSAGEAVIVTAIGQEKQN